MDRGEFRTRTSLYRAVPCPVTSPERWPCPEDYRYFGLGDDWGCADRRTTIRRSRENRWAKRWLAFHVASYWPREYWMLDESSGQRHQIANSGATPERMACVTPG